MNKQQGAPVFWMTAPFTADWTPPGRKVRGYPSVLDDRSFHSGLDLGMFHGNTPLVLDDRSFHSGLDLTPDGILTLCSRSG